MQSESPWEDLLEEPQSKMCSSPRIQTATHLITVDKSDFSPASRVLVLPKQKFAFCYIEKVACTEFNKLFNALNYPTDDGMVCDGTHETAWFQSQPQNFGIELSEITAENGWKWAVFLREPHSRYLSAWGSKCLQQEDFGINCVPSHAYANMSWTEQQQIEMFRSSTRLNYRNQSAMAANPHWANQSSFCGGLGDLSKFDMVGKLSGDVNSKVHQMLRMAGANESVADVFFPKRRVEGHGSHLDVKSFFASETSSLIDAMYAPDLALFNSLDREQHDILEIGSKA